MHETQRMLETIIGFRTPICVRTDIKEHSLKPLITAVYLLFTTKQLLSVYIKNSWERRLKNDQVVINSGFPTVNGRK